MKPTFYSLFTGGDLVGIGAKMAGYEIMGGVEYDPAIAEVARANGCPVTVGRVEDVSPYSLPSRPDHLHASPVCKNASIANANGGEADSDLSGARAVCDWIKVLMPATFTLENVWGYRNFTAYKMIRDTLDSCGYWSNEAHLNSADFGVPQTRKRLILRASRDEWLPPLPNKTRWIGWYEAIEDLLPGLPESEFAAWQLERLPVELRNLLSGGPGDILVDSQNVSSMTTREKQDPSFTVLDFNRPAHLPAAFLVGDQQRQLASPERPAFTVRAGEGGGELPKAFLVHPSEMRNMGCAAAHEPSFTVLSSKFIPRAFIASGMANDRGESMTARSSEEPVFTINAQCGGRQATRAWLQQGRVVKMTPRALARFQSVPDWYELPDKQSLACTIVGNGVPSLLMQKILEPMRP